MESTKDRKTSLVKIKNKQMMVKSRKRSFAGYLGKKPLKEIMNGLRDKVERLN